MSTEQLKGNVDYKSGYAAGVLRKLNEADGQNHGGVRSAVWRWISTAY